MGGVLEVYPICPMQTQTAQCYRNTTAVRENTTYLAGIFRGAPGVKVTLTDFEPALPLRNGRRHTAEHSSSSHGLGRTVGAMPRGSCFI